MKTLIFATLSCLVVMLSPSLRADDYLELEQAGQRIDAYPFSPEEKPRVVTVISEDTGLPVTIIEEQRNRTHLGYGSLAIANALARETGRSFDEIVALKASGHGWGEIARQYGVSGQKLGPIVSHMHRTDELFGSKERKLEHFEKKAEKFANGHDNGHRAKFGKVHGFGNGNGHGNGKAKGHGHKH